MEKIPQNFYEISEKRRELKESSKELGGKGAIFEKHYKKPLDEINEEAAKFKIADFGGLSGAKEIFKKQKSEYETGTLENQAQVDYETILEDTPEVGKAREVMKHIESLKDFRMKRMFEILNPKISPSTKKISEAVIESIKEEIEADEEKLTEVDPLILRQAELIKSKEDLGRSGHICITPNTEKDLEAIGDRMLTGKPMFLHGPTGTGKTSLARFAAEHFTGKDQEMVFCNPQTKESNVWGKTGIKPAEGGAIETVEIYGPLSKAMAEGKTVIFDEFTALPKEQMVFIKGVFNAKVGDKINIVGNGIVEIKPGFQMIFTANLKSEKNPERQDLPPEIAREFEQNNLEIRYTSPDEAYDIALSRLMNKDGSLDMSFYDLNTTLPNLCKVMGEIQESYTNETDKEVARRAGALDASGKTYSLKKFVMTQGSVEAILSSWLIEKQIGKKERSFAEFLDERFKTALTFKEYPREDRILAAKILASKGFLLTLTAKDLDLPEDIFKLNTIKSMRGDDALEELREKSGAVRHLTLKEVAELDPFGKRSELLRSQAEALLGEVETEKDPFLDDLNKRMKRIFGKEKKNQDSEISAEYTHPDGKKEPISLNLENELQDFLSFYQKTNLNLPPDFEQTIQDIWERNQDEMERAIEEKGFNGMLIIPGNIPLSELKDKMTMEEGYFTGSNFDESGGFAGAQNQNADQPRIILIHKKTLPKIQEENGLDVHLNIKAKEALKMFEKNPNEHMNLADFLIMEKKIFEELKIHISDYKESSGQWLNTKAGARLVYSNWDPGTQGLVVYAIDPEYQYSDLGVRPSRCFF